MDVDYDQLWKSWNPWRNIPAQYNLGVELTSGQVQKGRGMKTALYWESASDRTQTYTYHQLDALTNRMASSLRRLGIQSGDRVFLRLPIRPEFYIAALAIAKLGAVFIPSSTQFLEAEVRYR